MYSTTGTSTSHGLHMTTYLLFVIVDLRGDLISFRRENERSASLEVTGRTQTVVSREDIVGIRSCSDTLKASAALSVTDSNSLSFSLLDKSINKYHLQFCIADIKGKFTN